MEPTELCEIMGRYGSDKGSKDINNSWHNYTQIYYNLFKNMKDRNLRVFELGLGTNNPNIKCNMCFMNGGYPGASLKGWAEFFPNAKIFGADIDRDILFETDRIKTFYCDQTNPVDIKKMWDEKELWESFDIIIDDGLHEADANICFFENSIHRLKNGGYYIIEDLAEDRIKHVEKNFEKWTTQYPHISFKIIRVPSIVNPADNNLLVAQFNLDNRN